MTGNDHKFDGVWTAIVTPFKADSSIDWAAFETLLARQANAKVTGVVVFGTTGESPTLTAQEKLSLVKKARTLLPRDVRVMAGTGSNNTSQTIELSKLSADAGADSLLIVTPPYNKPSVAGLAAHIEAIADAVSLPICVYHVPARTGQFLSHQVLAEISNLPGVAAVKEASGDIAFFTRAAARSRACFLSGDDITYLPSLCAGGSGCISVVSNIFPKSMVRMTELFNDSQIDAAKDIHLSLIPVIDALFVESNPTPAKHLLNRMSFCGDGVRLPLVTPQPSSQELIQEAYSRTLEKLMRLGVAE